MKNKIDRVEREGEKTWAKTHKCIISCKTITKKSVSM